MNTVDHLRELLEYDHWANQWIIAALTVNDSIRSSQILAHILITKQEYFDRLAGKDSTGFDFWPELSIEESTQLATLTHRSYIRLLDNADESMLDKVTSYRTSEGTPHENTFREMLTHVLVHSSIHRGNIILKMREEGLEPPKIDYIIYLRERQSNVIT